MNVTELFHKNLFVFDWEKLGNEDYAPEFEPYYTFFVNFQNEFCKTWLAEHFADGLPKIYEGFDIFICWMPIYKFNSYLLANSINTYIDYTASLGTTWKPMLIARASNPQRSDIVHVFDEARKDWVLAPKLVNLKVLRWAGFDLTGRKEIPPDEFEEFNNLLKGYLRKHLFPSCWIYE